MDYETFMVWLGKGKDRAPSLYGGRVARDVEAVKLEEPPKESILPPLALKQEVPPQLDWQSRAAGERDEGGDGVEDEPQEESNHGG